MPHNVSVTVRHDDSKGVFYISECSVPGLEAKAEGLDELFRLVEERLEALAPKAAAA